MPFAVCNLPRVMRLLQSDISAKRTPLPAFQLKINAQYLEQKCIALIIEACGNARVRHEGCQQCFSLGLECITAYGLGPVAEEVANHSCARCLFNEKSCMGPGKTCSLRGRWLYFTGLPTLNLNLTLMVYLFRPKFRWQSSS